MASAFDAVGDGTSYLVRLASDRDCLSRARPFAEPPVACRFTGFLDEPVSSLFCRFRRQRHRNAVGTINKNLIPVSFDGAGVVVGFGIHAGNNDQAAISVSVVSDSARLPPKARVGSRP